MISLRPLSFFSFVFLLYIKCRLRDIKKTMVLLCLIKVQEECGEAILTEIMTKILSELMKDMHLI